ncbi:hypothetical protein V494_03435 [Pseudogymnoascus sp. VKM F-4513 (FW-928)]|nr:hypothetical protein V494_03435 [Pseudogymnoascus sp. VKM F-4513 (FW-928)]
MPVDISRSHRSECHLYQSRGGICNRCRKRKTKCLGGVPCRTCAISRQDCIYPNSQKKVLVSEGYLLDLESRVKAYETKAEESSVTPSSAAGTSEILDAEKPIPETSAPLQLTTSLDNNKDDIDKNPLIEGTAHLVLSPGGGERQYLGDSSSTSLGLRFQDFIKTFQSELNNGIEFDAPTQSRTNFSIRRNSFQESQPKISLPPFAFAKRLYAAQYAYLGTIFSFTDMDAFEENLHEIYDREVDVSDKDDCLVYCEVLLTLAFGQMYSVNQWTSNDGPPGFEYFQQAMQLLPGLHEQGSVTFIKVLSLVGYFFQNLNRRDTAFLYIGLALRMAISMGLHQEVPDQNLDDGAREHRRRLWWSVYSMDRILCVKSGNPLTIADQDIGVLPPSRLPDEPEMCPATVLLHYTELSRILGKIMKNLYRRTRTENYSLVSSVQAILSDLSNWHTNLPQVLQFDFTKLDKEISRESVSIYLHYSQCINMTARPLVFHVVRSRLQSKESNTSDWKTGLSPTTIAVIDTCISAARNSIAIMSTAAKQNLIATYGYMDGEHAFSAAIILVMINIAFPYNARDRAAMNMALEVLNGIAEKGNAHIKSLHRLLLSLYPMTRLDSSDETMIQKQAPEALAPPPDPFAAFLSQIDGDNANAGIFSNRDLSSLM